jgi:hypothetical protein
MIPADNWFTTPWLVAIRFWKPGLFIAAPAYEISPENRYIEKGRKSQP